MEVGIQNVHHDAAFPRSFIEQDCLKNECLNPLKAMTRTRFRVADAGVRIDARAWRQCESFQNITEALRIVVSRSAHLCEDVSRTLAESSRGAMPAGRRGTPGDAVPAAGARIVVAPARTAMWPDYLPDRTGCGLDRDKTGFLDGIRTQINPIDFQI
ncbi:MULTISPECIES: hypothetical protein [Burkholderia]|uniref:hypothetical protein n=1 Tax=Burkholderia TaxID=32008 RepID=UPI0013DDA996|nr:MULTISPECIES: hypothetical protein [Burkholderia]